MDYDGDWDNTDTGSATAEIYDNSGNLLQTVPLDFHGDYFGASFIGPTGERSTIDRGVPSG